MELEDHGNIFYGLFCRLLSWVVAKNFFQSMTEAGFLGKKVCLA